MWVRVTIDREFDRARDRSARPTACRIRAPATGSSPRTRSSSARTWCTGFRKRLHDDDGRRQGLHARDRAARRRCRPPRCRRSRACGARTRAKASRSSSTAATRSRRRPTPCAATTRSGIAALRSDLLDGGADVKIHEYQGKEIFRKFGMPTPRGIPAFQRRRGGRGGAVARRHGLGRQGADPRRRPRQGRRRQGRASLDEVRELAGKILGMQLVTHQTGPARPEGAPAADRGRRRHQEGALRRHGRRPRHAARRADGELRRRHGHRGSRREDAGEDPQGVHRSGARA